MIASADPQSRMSAAARPAGVRPPQQIPSGPARASSRRGSAVTAGARTSRLGGSHRWPSEPLPHTVVWHYIAGLLAGLALTRAEIGKRLSRRGPAVRLQPTQPPEAAPARATACRGNGNHRQVPGPRCRPCSAGKAPSPAPGRDPIGWRIRGEVQPSVTSRQARSYMAAVCKTVGSAYVGSNPTPATIKCPGQSGFRSVMRLS